MTAESTTDARTTAAAPTRSTLRTGAVSRTPRRRCGRRESRAPSWTAGHAKGAAALVATVEGLTGVHIDHFAEINLAGFVELTDAVGGVPVCLNAAVRDSYSWVDLPAGPQTVAGPTALAFVRQRHGLDGGDLDRIARQQVFISGLAQRLESTGALTDPVRVSRLVDVVTRNVVIDRGWDIDQALAQLRRLAGDELSFHTIPTGRPDLPTPVDGIAVEVDRPGVRAYVRGLVSGAPAPGPSTTAVPPYVVAGSTGITQPNTPTTAARVITADGITCVD